MISNIVFLAGFMASGKSTIGPILANTLGWDFYDLDRVIEKKMEKKINNIFADLGEQRFREIERDTLNEIAEGQNLIISLGGGTVVSRENIELMKKKGLIIFLDANVESFYRRLQFKNDRPMLKGKNSELLSPGELKQKINSLLNNRLKFYKQADITVNTDKKTIGQTVDEIAKIIRKKMSDTKGNNN